MKKYLYIIIALTTITGCSDFFDRDPYNSVGSDEFYNSESALKIHSNGLINKNLPGVGSLCWGDQYSDIIAVNTSDAFLLSDWSPEQQGGWGQSHWNGIYDVNYYLSRIYEASSAINDDKIMKHYEGVGRFWRAWLYFDKVKTFGNVPWYDMPIDPEDYENLYKARDSRELVMQKVLEDLDFAIMHCSTDDSYLNNTLINKYVALALKSRICLFEGTYRKYHEIHLDTYKKWLNECILASEELINSGVYNLLNDPTNLQTQYRSLFTSEDPNYQEIILANEFNTDKARFHNATWKYTSGSYGNRWSPTKQFVNTYLNLDGSRFTDKANYNKTEYFDEMQDRDYRLKQSIISPWYTKITGGKETNITPDFSVTLTGYQIIKWSLDDEKYEGVENSNNSLPVFRLGEVLLNYAEAKAELEEMTTDIWNKTIKPLRERSGVNGRPPIEADPYLAKYYNIDDKWILEVRRERAIELLLEGFRYDDLMRWKLGHLLKNEWDGIYIPYLNQAQDLNKDGKNDFSVVTNSAGNEPGVYYLNLSTMTDYSLNEDNCLVYRNDVKWSDNKYLRPIPKNALDINPDLGQNPGW